ncbi:SDR family oxidoreductase [Methylobacterium aquaticum]|uniref:NAD-dependent dehydratase n=1 Tax=Methylobacterium aquaticum TaxID=270351 RepID=A0A0J6T1K3_9HYPH|nr:SDR family oxidoreductase [Methylobacterium aquaticum]KMO39859.1 NAD-dependent dehydratase [Methylobacterium aquaticum]
MRVFLTGATGFIGSAIVAELLAAGHQVLGLTRSETGARALHDAGAEPHLGNLDDLDSLRGGVARADGVIHTAFDHDDFTNFAANCEKDRRAIEALGSPLKGSDRPLIITSGTGAGSTAPGLPATEDVFNTEHPNPRIASELAGAMLSEAGVNVSVVRLPQVHDTVKQGLVTYLLDLARRKGVSAYVGDGAHRWSAAHVLDVARLYRLALERQTAGARYHAVAEEGVPTRAIADVLGRGLNVPVKSVSPEEAAGHFEWLGAFAGVDMSASSAWTQARLGWHPTGPGLIADLEAMRHHEVAH